MRKSSTKVVLTEWWARAGGRGRNGQWDSRYVSGTGDVWDVYTQAILIMKQTSDTDTSRKRLAVLGPTRAASKNNSRIVEAGKRNLNCVDGGIRGVGGGGLDG